MRFTHFDVDAFLRDHWQKRPLLIRDPWRGWANPLEPDELAGLACEEDVESRLVTRARGGWRLEHGPLPAARFAKLGKKPWTLLVQSVDQHVPGVAALLDAFAFIPNWRVDDVMVSYATDGGGVGPHFDQYDVFLIQGLGRRRWRVGGACDATTPLLPHDDLRLLAEFAPTDEWVLEPGDILYLPPGIGHDGVAVGDDCMTYSIGFRAPSRGDLVAGWSEDVLGRADEGDRYRDPDLRASGDPGEIDPAAIVRLHAMVTETLGDRDAFARWFGQYASAPKNADVDWRPEVEIEGDALCARLGSGEALHRNPASRLSFLRQGADALVLFVDGASFECAGEVAAFAQGLCALDRSAVVPVPPGAAIDLVLSLVNLGALAFDEDG